MAAAEESPTPPAGGVERPLDLRRVFGILLALGIPATLAVKAWGIHHTWGAIGVGFTLAYAIVLVLIWTGRAPREKAAPRAALVAEEAQVFLRVVGSTALLSVVNAGERPLLVPGLADGVGGGLEIEALLGGRTVARAPVSPTLPDPLPVLEVPPTRYDFVSASFDPERSPSARTVRVPLDAVVGPLPPGRYDLRIRWDATPFAGEGRWTPREPVVLGIFPFRARGRG